MPGVGSAVHFKYKGEATQGKVIRILTWGNFPYTVEWFCPKRHKHITQFNSNEFIQQEVQDVQDASTTH